MNNQLDKIFNFVKRTGDKAVVFKDEAEFIVMPLDDYNNFFSQTSDLASLSESEFLNKINREIALWRASQQELDNKSDELDFLSRPEDVRYDSLDDLPKPELELDNYDIDLEPHEDWMDDFEQHKSDDSFDEKEDYSKLYNEQEPELELDWDKDEDLITPEEEDKVIEEDKIPEFDFDDLKKDESLVDGKEPQIEPAMNVNNFGYVNPSDTDLETDIIDDLPEFDEEDDDFGLTLNEKQQKQDFNDFDKIPSPPDLKNS